MSRPSEYVSRVGTLTAWFVLSLYFCSPAIVSGSTKAERYYQIGTDHFYSFEFAEALSNLKEALELGDAPRSLEYRYWVSKVLWVYLLDQQIAINEDFMTVLLDKDLTKQPRIDPDVRREFFGVTRGGIKIAAGILQEQPDNLEAVFYLAAFQSNLAAYNLLLEGKRLSALSDIKKINKFSVEVLLSRRFGLHATEEHSYYYFGLCGVSILSAGTVFFNYLARWVFR